MDNDPDDSGDQMLTTIDNPDDQMLTTIDNPWSPYTNYDEWYAWDLSMGYNTPGLLARIANVSPELSFPDYDAALSQAMNEIVTENVSGMHRLAVRPAA